jgi:hypothetical protein
MFRVYIGYIYSSLASLISIFNTTVGECFRSLRYVNCSCLTVWVGLLLEHLTVQTVPLQMSTGYLLLLSKYIGVTFVFTLKF